MFIAIFNINVKRFQYPIKTRVILFIRNVCSKIVFRVEINTTVMFAKTCLTKLDSK